MTVPLMQPMPWDEARDGADDDREWCEECDQEVSECGCPQPQCAYCGEAECICDDECEGCTWGDE